MRVLGGALRGRRMAGPRGRATRPTAGRVKAALFSILADRLPEARFLDLFAGTGLVGIEALSRGAQHVTFVESDPAIRRVLKANLERCGYAARAEVKATAAARFLKEPPAQLYDIVFVDPPYHSAEGEKILPSLGRGAIIQRTGVVVIEHFHKNPLPVCIGGLTLLKTYRYGDTILSLYRPVPSECPA